jgi:hypothetical protein
MIIELLKLPVIRQAQRPFAYGRTVHLVQLISRIKKCAVYFTINWTPHSKNVIETRLFFAFIKIYILSQLVDSIPS